MKKSPLHTNLYNYNLTMKWYLIFLWLSMFHLRNCMDFELENKKLNGKCSELINDCECSDIFFNWHENCSNINEMCKAPIKLCNGKKDDIFINKKCRKLSPSCSCEDLDFIGKDMCWDQILRKRNKLDNVKLRERCNELLDCSCYDLQSIKQTNCGHAYSTNEGENKILNKKMMKLPTHCNLFSIKQNLDGIKTCWYTNKNKALKSKCDLFVPGCSCSEFRNFGHISCLNASELFATKYLRNGSIFQVKDFLDIEVRGGLTTIPSRSLEGLNIFRLILRDPGIQFVDKDALQNVSSLTAFHVICSSLRDIPNFHPSQNSLIEVDFRNSLLNSLDGNELKDLPLLEYISFRNNSIEEIGVTTFEGTNNVIIFDVSYNKLTSLPPKLFDSWKELKIVRLSHNQLLQVDGLFKHNCPPHIYLDYNNLTAINSILHSSAGNLISLRLSNNPIKEVPTTSFEGKAPMIQAIYLDHCLIRIFDWKAFEDLLHMKLLNLSYNEIKKISVPDLFMQFNGSLLLEGNRMREFSVGIFAFKRGADYLRHGEWKQYPPNDPVLDISVAKNEIQHIDFVNFFDVWETGRFFFLYRANKNQIKTIYNTAFYMCKESLRYLDLSYNLLKSLNGSVQYLGNLEYINLSWNFITIFEEEEFLGLTNLQEIYLSNNRIISLGGVFYQLPKLKILELSNNSIETIKPHQLPRVLLKLYIRDNPIRCDCKLIPFLRLLFSRNEPEIDIPTLCLSLPLDSPKSQPCPSGCNCSCTADDESQMLVDCSSRNISVLPQFLTADHSIDNSSLIRLEFPNTYFFENNAAYKWMIPSTNPRVGEFFVIVDEIRKINLSNNSLVSWEYVQLPVDLNTLFLHKNNFTTFSKHYTDFSKIKRITFSHNPWRCDCDAVDFWRWILLNIEIIEDVNETMCGKDSRSEENVLTGKSIAILDERDLCPVFIELYFSISFGLIAFFLAITILKIVHTKYKLDIYVWLYTHGVTCFKEKDIDRDKKFDAFLSFSHRDQELVILKIIHEIEMKQPKTKLLLHYKHFNPGEFIEKNIHFAVQNSKRTVIMLSRNFLESEWCIHEFRTAHLQALKDKINRVIVIILGDFPDEIPSDIKVYLKSRTYLVWGEKNFWKKLFYVLPTSSDQMKPDASIYSSNDENFEAYTLIEL